MTNFTNITNYFEGQTTLKGLLNITNQTTSGWGWIGLHLMMFVIILLAFLPFGFNAAMLSASFIALISGLFLVYLELISWTWLMPYLGMILLIIIYIIWQERE